MVGDEFDGARLRIKRSRELVIETKIAVAQCKRLTADSRAWLKEYRVSEERQEQESDGLDKLSGGRSMRVRCHAEDDGQGIVLSKIASGSDADDVRNFIVDRGILAIVSQPAGPSDHRVFISGMTVGLLAKLIAGSHIELTN